MQQWRSAKTQRRSERCSQAAEEAALRYRRARRSRRKVRDCSGLFSNLTYNWLSGPSILTFPGIPTSINLWTLVKIRNERWHHNTSQLDALMSEARIYSVPIRPASQCYCWVLLSHQSFKKQTPIFLDIGEIKQLLSLVWTKESLCLCKRRQ